MGEDDIFMAMLQGMDPSKTQQYAQKLRGQQGLSDLFSLSGKKSIAESGKSLGAEALGTATGLGNAAATRKYRDEMMASQQAQMDRADTRALQQNEFTSSENALNRALSEKLARVSASTRRTPGGYTDDDINRYRSKYSDQLEKAGLPEIETSIGELNKTLADYRDPESGMLKGDLPGTGPLGRFSIGDEARNIQRMRQQASNILLKARSGAAVTEPEFDRFKKEFAGTMVSTDQDFLDAWDDFQATVAAKRRNIEQGIPKEARIAYDQDLGGSFGGTGQAGGAGASVSGPAYLMGDPESYFD